MFLCSLKTTWKQQTFYDKSVLIIFRVELKGQINFDDILMAKSLKCGTLLNDS